MHNIQFFILLTANPQVSVLQRTLDWTHVLLLMLYQLSYIPFHSENYSDDLFKSVVNRLCQKWHAKTATVLLKYCIGFYSCNPSEYRDITFFFKIRIFVLQCEGMWGLLWWSCLCLSSLLIRHHAQAISMEKLWRGDHVYVVIFGCRGWGSGFNHRARTISPPASTCSKDR